MDEPTNIKKHKAIIPQKVFDVAKPGKTVPSQNGRPVILTHSALPHDTVISNDDKNSLGDSISDEAEQLEDEPNEIKVRSTKSRIEPDTRELIEDSSMVPDAEEIETEQPEQVAPVEQVEKQSDSEQHEQPKQGKRTSLVVEPLTQATDPKQGTETESDEDLDEISEFAGQAAAKRAKKTEDEESLKQFQAGQELLESKKYVVPISHRHAHTAAGWFVALLLVLSAVSAGAYWYFFAQ